MRKSFNHAILYSYIPLTTYKVVYLGAFIANSLRHLVVKVDGC